MVDLTPRFVPTLGAGVIVAAVTAIATTRNWLAIDGGAGVVSADVLAGLREANPLASALSLVLLAAWGTILVTRRRTRRLIALVAAVAALAVGGAVVSWVPGATTDAAAELTQAGAVSAEASLEVWVWVSLIGALASVALALTAYAGAPHWPEMGSRYDAPGTPAAASAEQGPADPERDPSIEVWRAIDEGRDPTLDTSA